MKQKHIHFIGICGVAMSAIAVAFHKKDWRVTGSDKGFFPPVSTYLKNAGIEYYPGWHVEKMTEQGDPDLVVVGNVAGSSNPEWQYVQEKKLNYKSYPEVINEYFCKKDNIVCAGTYGKTTTAALLSWIFLQAKQDISYMFGGLSLNDIDSAHISDEQSDFSLGIFEGDEYKTSRADMRAKFVHYKPVFVVLTGAQWDHADIYKTADDYKQAFVDLLEMIPSKKNNMGSVIACIDDKNVQKIITHVKSELITFGQGEQADYRYSDVAQNESGLAFTIHHKHKTYEIRCQLIGEYNAQNITGAFAMANRIGIQKEKIIKAITTFKGLKRRMEKRFEGQITVIDDIAHSPAKAASVLSNLKKIYKGKIIAVFEPNTGNRLPSAVEGYKNAFKDADIVLIPRLTRVKQNPQDTEHPMDGVRLREILAKKNPSTQIWYCSDDEESIDLLVRHSEPGDVIAFLGSHGFRGIIENLVEKLKK